MHRARGTAGEPSSVEAIADGARATVIFRAAALLAYENLRSNLIVNAQLCNPLLYSKTASTCCQFRLMMSVSRRTLRIFALQLVKAS